MLRVARQTVAAAHHAESDVEVRSAHQNLADQICELNLVSLTHRIGVDCVRKQKEKVLRLVSGSQDVKELAEPALLKQQLRQLPVEVDDKAQKQDTVRDERRVLRVEALEKLVEKSRRK
jgi:hypothetical protein